MHPFPVLALLLSCLLSAQASYYVYGGNSSITYYPVNEWFNFTNVNGSSPTSCNNQWCVPICPLNFSINRHSSSHFLFLVNTRRMVEPRLNSDSEVIAPRQKRLAYITGRRIRYLRLRHNSWRCVINPVHVELSPIDLSQFFTCHPSDGE
jgi:hypothetical protein